VTWPRAILFDVDGTLAETEEWHRAAFNQSFAANGLDWHWDQTLYGRLLEVAGGIERIRYFAGAGAGDVDVRAIHAVKNACYRQRLRGGSIALRPGIAELIDHARGQSIRLGVATTTSRANVDALIARTLGPGASAWFEVIACAEDAAPKKPDPAVYRFALESLGIAPYEVLAVEDSANGLRAAVAAGIPCLVTPSLYCRNQGAARALLVLDDLASLSPKSLLDALGALPR
jgi:HAD superfamily hydrolase (TIGR01509 family)